MFKVTEEWVKAFQSKSGGWNREQLKCVGVVWPPSAGWIQQLSGQLITDDSKLGFEQMMGRTKKVIRAERRVRTNPIVRFKQLLEIYERMPVEERDALHEWEHENIDGHSIGTTDWPGWRKYL